MNIKIRKINFTNLIWSVLLIASTLWIGNKEADKLALMLVVVETVVIMKKAKFSFFSIFSVLVNYCLIVEWLAFNNMYVYGILGYQYVNIYFFEMFFCCSAFNIILLFFIDVIGIANNEKKIYSVNFEVSNTATWIYCLIAVVVTLLIFPTLPGNYVMTLNRFSSGIIPFTGWSCIPYFFVAVSIMGRKRKKIIMATAMFVIIWYASHGERVDAIGLIVFLVIWVFNSVKLSKTKKIGLFLICAVMAVLLTFVGITRGGNSVGMNKLIMNLLVQTTACDITHVFNCAVDFYKVKGGFHGITYISYLINCIPYLQDPYMFSARIMEFGYQTAGGSHFFSEPFSNGGFVLVVIESIVFFGFLNMLLRKKSLYTTLIYVEIFLNIFRLAWYGLSYPITTCVYFVPFAIVINQISLVKSSKKFYIGNINQ